MTAIDPILLSDLLTAGLQPELVTRIVTACADSYARGLIDGQSRRSKGAERQARYRERHKTSQTSQSVTERNEASQLTPSLSPTPPIPKYKNSSMRDKRGTRIPDDWRPSEADARAEGLNDLDISREAARFRDYWKARSGSGGVKLDWAATWRNWCRNSAEKLGRERPSDATPSGKTQVLVMGDTPQFEAWCKFTGKRWPTNKKGGWYFDSEWPPEQEDAA